MPAGRAIADQPGKDTHDASDHFLYNAQFPAGVNTYRAYLLPFGPNGFGGSPIGHQSVQPQAADTPGRPTSRVGPAELYRSAMASRTRILLFGGAGALVIAGGACAALVGGVTGEVLTIVLISGGLTGGLLLVFLEIGLEEERDLASEERKRRRTLEGLGKRKASRHPRLTRRPRRPG
jgi:hypothetical protein